eukprot:1791108-Pyramimonas_sp.AAC.2
MPSPSPPPPPSPPAPRFPPPPAFLIQHNQTGSKFPDLYDLSFTGRDRGWASGALGTILRTENSGDTWDVLSTGPWSAVTFHGIRYGMFLLCTLLFCSAFING